jgi:hypothetical protein
MSAKTGPKYRSESLPGCPHPSPSEPENTNDLNLCTRKGCNHTCVKDSPVMVAITATVAAGLRLAPCLQYMSTRLYLWTASIVSNINFAHKSSTSCFWSPLPGTLLIANGANSSTPGNCTISYDECLGATTQLLNRKTIVREAHV